MSRSDGRGGTKTAGLDGDTDPTPFVSGRAAVGSPTRSQWVIVAGTSMPTGCHASLRLGNDHVSGVVRQLANVYSGWEGEMRLDWTYWTWREVDNDALNALNAVTVDGWWSFQDGDLILRHENDAEELSDGRS